MDYRMPHKNGLLVAREILRFNPNCKIVFISAESSIRTEALNMG
ncbi:MAG: response regulator transcription factor [Promethearchaeota archaeon]